MDLFASLFFSPGPAPGFFVLAPGWRYTCGGHGWPRVVLRIKAMALHMRRPWMAESRVAHKGDGATHAEAMEGRESCCAYSDGATHAEAMEGRESCCA